ncbi:MAG: polyprenyl synthetase family protein [Candidatus Bipolaricaulota bacterium]|nr:MAG: polyprenyl synthetase family protein [Candidatus Bipolaricaulota bacterium]
MGLGILTRHRTQILEALSATLAGESPLRASLRYHAGLTDEQGERVDASGKLLRPSLVLFVAGELGGTADRAMPAAVALELVHNFSLIHDDIQDGDRMRRGRPTVWTLWGTGEAINAGDLMYTLAIETALRAGDGVAELLLRATDEMIEGQSLDLGFEDRPATLEEYLEMIDRKTGALLCAAFELGAVVADADRSVRKRLRALGRSVGRAFQIQDDLLGVWGDSEIVGKPNGSDIRRRKRSYPVILAFEKAQADDRATLEATYARESSTDEEIATVVAIMDRLGILEAGQATVREHLEEAARVVEALPFSTGGRDEMTELIAYLARRGE